MSSTRELPTLSYQEGRLLMDENARRQSIPSVRNITHAFRVQGRFDESVFAASLAALVRRHEGLRVSFPNGAHTQVLHEDVTVCCPVEDADSEVAARGVAETEMLTPFAADEAPRIRARVLRLAADDRLVVLVLDHLIVDATARATLLAELSELYAAALAGRPAELAPVEYTYSDLVRDQRALLDGPERDRLLAFWTTSLDGVGAIPSLAAPRPDDAPVGGAGATRTLPAAFKQDLLGFAARERVTLFMVVLCALQVSLARRGGTDDVAVAVNVYSRDTVGTECLVAPMAELMVVRTDLAGAGTVRQALRRTRSSALDAQEHAKLPYAEIVKTLSPDRYADPQAPIGVVLNMLYAEVIGGSLRLPEATCVAVPVAAVAARRPRSELIIGGDSSGDGLVLGAQYQTDRLSADFVAGLLDDLVENLRAAVLDQTLRAAPN